MYDASPMKTCGSWDQLGAFLGITTQVMAHALTHKADLVKKIRIEKRTVYKSDSSLFKVQNALAAALGALFESLPGTDAAIAYRRGRTRQGMMKDMVGHDWLITTDVVKFFDNIRFGHIVKSLEMLGFANDAAKLIARYCTVRDRNGAEVLQQGSPASSAISNIVGHCLFDKYIEQVCDELQCLYGVKILYRRYCDNLGFCVDGSDFDIRGELRDLVWQCFSRLGFSLHDWAFVKNDQTDALQYFVGVVLNHRMRVLTWKLDESRSMLLNLALHGPSKSHEIGKVGGGTSRTKWRRLKLKYNGVIAYIGSINKAHGEGLRKLLSAADLLWSPAAYDTWTCPVEVTETPELVQALTKYKHKESVSDYLKRIKDILRSM